MEKAEKVVFKFDAKKKNGEDRYYLFGNNIPNDTTNLRKAQDFVEELNPSIEDLDVDEGGRFVTYIESVSYELVDEGEV
jgi:hypothetical protein